MRTEGACRVARNGDNEAGRKGVSAWDDLLLKLTETPFETDWAPMGPARGIAWPEHSTR